MVDLLTSKNKYIWRSDVFREFIIQYASTHPSSFSVEFFKTYNMYFASETDWILMLFKAEVLNSVIHI